MLKFALKNMAIKKVQIILVVLSIVISAGIGVLAFNVATQVNDGITSGVGNYGLIIGPAGSSTQLAMNTLYFSEEPLGTIPFSVISDLSQEMSVKKVIPFSMADSYNGYGVVGTTSEYLYGEYANKKIALGKSFDDSSTMQAVVGAKVAQRNELKIGDVIYTSHSASGLDKHEKGLTIVGILEESHSSFDNIVFTQYKTLWEMHDHGDGDEGEHEEHEEHNHSGNSVCAFILVVNNPGAIDTLIQKYDDRVITCEDGDSHILQAINPDTVMRGVLQDANNTKYIILVLCAVILVMNVMIISIITLLNMYHSAKEISLMRLIGISMNKINLLYLIQNGIMGLFSVVMAFGVSRLCMFFMNDYVESMLLHDELEKLNCEEMSIIKNRYINDLTQTETANIMGMSQVQVSRKEQKVLQKLKKRLVA